jgi:hypothetical protein
LYAYELTHWLISECSAVRTRKRYKSFIADGDPANLCPKCAAGPGWAAVSEKAYEAFAGK